MRKLLVYSHDTYGLGNIRRMLAICRRLIEVIPDLSILLVTGSPVIHSLRLPELLDYIKLPCLTRTGRGEYSTKYLNADINDAIRLRSDLILAAVANFKPDLLMVDKKPLGVKGELAATLDYLQTKAHQTRRVLILRDILDSPETIISNWERNGHYDAAARYYDQVLVLGEQKIFDPVKEYRFPRSVAGKTVFCGYVGKEKEGEQSDEVRRDLGVGEQDKLVLVTPGGGQDGYHIIENYLAGIKAAGLLVKSLIVCGPEMPGQQKIELQKRAAADPNAIFYEFTGEMMSLMSAADVVVAMGGYNTVCEIISLKKRAIVIPRVRPTQEQLMRAEKMSRLGLFKMIHPDELSPESLIEKVNEYMAESGDPIAPPVLDLNGLPKVAGHIRALLR
jgi:predicted glycosyltransferase